MQKLSTAVILVSICLSASPMTPPGLFATVVKVAQSDTLNVRESPGYRSKKTGALPEGAFVGVDSCKKRGRSVWCRIFHIAQRDYENFGYDARPGWVNARYLTFNDRGYVIIDGKPNCDYALRCKNNRCEVAAEYTTDPQTQEVTSVKTRWIERKRLEGTNHFGAMPDDPDASGYCNTRNYIEAFLRKQKERSLLGTRSDPLQKKVLDIVTVLNEGDMDAFMDFIHPKKGIVLTWSVRFGGKKDRFFTRSDITNSAKKIHWGYTYGKGDEVRMSLYDYLSKLSRPITAISKIEELKTLNGFHCPLGDECKGYEVLWIDKSSKTPEYDWQGLVVIFEKYQGKWYLAGLLRDRWTI